ncbi:unnamed protein product [Linum tenue]|uniref:Uncharacterized protein n=1 Tax=Linum tenue TaxID=586396 RepID=A0AAV0IGG5_9ROSI|nr:unnamed protein product [Linum tenue]
MASLAPHRVAAAAAVLLIFCIGFFLAMEGGEAARAARICPMYCLDVAYMTCNNSSSSSSNNSTDEHLRPACNCCLAPKNCTLHLANGSSMNCLHH